MRKEPTTAPTEIRARKPWSPPKYSRIRAGEAELGANPVRQEGIFALGS